MGDVEIFWSLRIDMSLFGELIKELAKARVVAGTLAQLAWKMPKACDFVGGAGEKLICTCEINAHIQTRWI